MRLLPQFGLAFAILTAPVNSGTSRLFAAEPVSRTATTARSLSVASQRPRVFLLDPAVLRANKQRLRDGDKNLMAAFALFERDAQRQLSAGPFSVLDKDFV